MSVEYAVPHRKGNPELLVHMTEVKFHVAPCGRFAVFVEMENFNYRTVIMDLLYGRKFELNDSAPGCRYRQIVGIQDDFSAIAVMAHQFYEAVNIDLKTGLMSHRKGICQSHNNHMSPQTINDGRFLLIYKPFVHTGPNIPLQIVELSTLRRFSTNIREMDAGIAFAARVTADGRLLVIGGSFFATMSLLESPLLAEASETTSAVRKLPLVGGMWDRVLDNVVQRGPQVEPRLFLDFLDDEHFVGVRILNPCTLFVGLVTADDVVLLGVSFLDLDGGAAARVRSVSCNNGVTYVSYTISAYGTHSRNRILRLNLRRPQSLLLSAHFAALTSGRKFELPQLELVETLPQFGPNPYKAEGPSANQRNNESSTIAMRSRGGDGLLIRPRFK